jgi:dimeric dUTPase (all-alpha-NTP-PPase superfamily)
MADFNKEYDYAAIAAGLHELQRVQEEVSGLVPGALDLTSENLRTYGLALMVEIAEFIQELPWKPWRENRPTDTDRVTDEFADILAFIGLIINYLEQMGISHEELAAAYFRKTLVNVERLTPKTPGGN